MTRRRQWPFGAAVVVICGVAAMFWFATRPYLDLPNSLFHAMVPRLNQVASDEELAAMVGQPPGDYTTWKRPSEFGGCGKGVGADARSHVILDEISKGTNDIDSFCRLANSAAYSDRKLSLWRNRTQVLLVIRDQENRVRGFVLNSWCRRIATTLAAKCEDWLYERFYGKD